MAALSCKTCQDLMVAVSGLSRRQVGPSRVAHAGFGDA